MKMTRRWIAGLLTAAVCCLALSGCTTFDNFKEAFINKDSQADDTIRIGVYEPMSGSDEEGGRLEVEGIELANELYPEVLGKKVELVYADNKSDMDSAETAMADLMKKQPLVVLGSYGNIYSLIASHYLEEAKVPGIAITNTNPLVTSNHPYYFRVCFVESYQGEALARYVYEERNEKTSGIMVPENNDQAVSMASTFKDKMVELTGDDQAITVYQTFESGAEDFSAQLQAIKDSGVNTVFLAGDMTDAVNVLKQAKKMNLDNVTFLGDSTWESDEFRELAGNGITNNVAFSTLYTDEETVTETSQEFLDAYEEKYGKESADAATALGFDAYLIAIQAIERAGENCTGETVREALAQTENFQGASGEITFDSIGDPKKSVVINTFENQKITSICTIAPDEPEQQSDKSKKQEKKKEEKKNGTEN